MKNWKDLIKRWSELGKDILRMLNEWLDIGLGKVTVVRLTNEQFVYGLLITVFAAANLVLWVQKWNGFPITALDMPEVVEKQEEIHPDQLPHTARIMANGDQLYHDLVYMSAVKEDGSYDFSENYHYAQEWLKQGDLVLGDFEGTINSDYGLSGYPIFNAPGAVVASIKDAGYQVMDLGHNHILDTGLEGLFSTAKAFEDAGIQTVGVYPHETRDQAPILIKEVNGIKIAILAYSYGFNGMEAYLDQGDYDNRLSDLNEERMRKEIQKAEMEADITIVMPQMGIEYEMRIISAHREPDVFFSWANGARERGLSVIIAGAGKAAHLPGMCAALFTLPVIGVPMKTSDLGGVDSLYSIVQMPSGIPCATVAINGGKNAGILAAKMLAVGDKALEEKLQAFQKEMRDEVVAKDDKLQREGYQSFLK